MANIWDTIKNGVKNSFTNLSNLGSNIKKAVTDGGGGYTLQNAFNDAGVYSTDRMLSEAKKKYKELGYSDKEAQDLANRLITNNGGTGLPQEYKAAGKVAEFIQKQEDYAKSQNTNLNDLYDLAGNKTAIDPTKLNQIIDEGNAAKTAQEEADVLAAQQAKEAEEAEKARVEAEKRAQEEAAKAASDAAAKNKLATQELAESQGQEAATSGYTQAMNSGLGKARAGMQTGSGMDASTQAAMNNTIASQHASTQADYLNKMGQVNGMNQNANNLAKGSALNTIGATLQGASTGLSIGNSLFGTSDENEKQPVDHLSLIKEFYTKPQEEEKLDEPSTEQILEATEKFMDLYNQLKQLKENK